MVLENLLKDFAGIATNGTGYWIVAMLVAVLLFVILRAMEVRHATVISLVLPVLLLEFILRFVFGFLGVPLDFGTYILDIPFYSQIPITTGSQILRFLDFVFNFGLFRAVGLPIFLEFMKTAPVLPAPSIFVNIFVAIYVSADSIVEFIFFYYVFSALLILTSDILGLNGKNLKLYAAVLGTLPVIAYMVLVSNPLLEYGQAMPQIQSLFYFFGKADILSLAIFSITLIISFLLVMEILAAVVSLFYQTGSATFRPDWVQKQWSTDVQGVGFMYTLSFAIMYAMHQYAWYVFFPAMVIYSLFKKMAGGAVTVARAHEERMEMREFLGAGGQINNGVHVNNGTKKGTGTGSNLIIYGLIVVVIVMAVMLARNMGIVKF